MAYTACSGRPKVNISKIKYVTPRSYCANKVVDVAKLLGTTTALMASMAHRRSMEQTSYKKINSMSKVIGVTMEELVKMSGKEVILAADRLLTERKYHNRALHEVQNERINEPV